MSFRFIILGAGKGTRMHSKKPKILHLLGGYPLIDHVLESLKGWEKPILVVGFGAEAVKAHVTEDKAIFVLQDPPAGTGDAVRVALSALKDEKWVGIVPGDVPLLKEKTLQDLVDAFHAHQADLMVLTAYLQEPKAYGRIQRDEQGRVCGIVEARDGDPEILAIQEVNTGVYIVRRSLLEDLLPTLRCDNAQGEYYLTDIVKAAYEKGHKVLSYTLEDPQEMMGVNSPMDLAEVQQVYFRYWASYWMARGVILVDPSTTYINHKTNLEADTLIYPGCLLFDAQIGKGCTLWPHGVIIQSRIGRGTEIYPGSFIQHAFIGENCRIGPMAHIRLESNIGDHCRVGNFVEVKKSFLGQGTKAAHLTYLGDAQLGLGVNVGCGTITCNYDGINKHQTIIEDEVFIGSDVQLVAPIRVGKGAYIGAGSTITQDVPSYALAVARGRQRNILDWVHRKKRRKS